jgi:hypothetical protein
MRITPELQKVTTPALREAMAPVVSGNKSPEALARLGERLLDTPPVVQGQMRGAGDRASDAFFLFRQVRSLVDDPKTIPLLLNAVQTAITNKGDLTMLSGFNRLVKSE